MADKKKTKSKIKKKVSSGIAHVVSSFNNTIITITDENGKFKIEGIGVDHIRAYEVGKYGHKQQSGTHILYMGKFKKSSLCDNLYNCPHKLVSVSLKGES